MAVTAGELHSDSKRVMLGNLLADSMNRRRELYLRLFKLHLDAYREPGPYSEWPKVRPWYVRTADWKRTGL